MNLGLEEPDIAATALSIKKISNVEWIKWDLH
jgi:hypothetical protein